MEEVPAVGAFLSEVVTKLAPEPSDHHRPRPTFDPLKVYDAPETRDEPQEVSKLVVRFDLPPVTVVLPLDVARVRLGAGKHLSGGGRIRGALEFVQYERKSQRMAGRDLIDAFGLGCVEPDREASALNDPVYGIPPERP